MNGNGESTALAPVTQQQIAKAPRPPAEDNGLADVFLNPARFEQMQRGAKVFSDSDLVPDHMRGKVANCIIALALAREMGASPLAVMQAIHFVRGKAGWSAQYMIARANQSGVFRGRISWRIDGKGDAMRVTAFATLADTGEVVEAEASMEMARAEGWTANTKYKSMPDVMLRYRSATFLIRLYCPEVMHGYRTADEIEDMAAAGREPERRATVAAEDVDLTTIVEIQSAEPARTPDGATAVDELRRQAAGVTVDGARVVDEQGNPLPDPPETAEPPRRPRNTGGNGKTQSPPAGTQADLV